MKILLVLSLLCSLLFCSAAPAADAPAPKAPAAQKNAGKKKTVSKAAFLAAASKKAAPPKAAAAPPKAAPPKAAPPAPKAPAKKAAVPAAADSPVPSPRKIAIDFRGGKVIRAEISSRAPSIKGFNEKNFLNLPAKRIYAALTLISDADRALSIHDYCLDHYGVFHCVAIREGRGTFVSSPEQIIQTKAETPYTLLFILDAAVAGSDEELCTLKALCDDGPFSKQQIPFVNLKNSPFTVPEKK